MKKTARTAFLLLSLLCSCGRPLMAAEPLPVSLVQLIANPNDYDGKVVRVIGFVSLEFEGTAVYLHQDDYRHCIHKNGLWIEVRDEILKKKEGLDRQYVLLEGIFIAKKTGHMGLWSGSIEKVSRLQVWMDRDRVNGPAKDAGRPNGGGAGSQPIRSHANLLAMLEADLSEATAIRPALAAEKSQISAHLVGQNCGNVDTHIVLTSEKQKAFHFHSDFEGGRPFRGREPIVVV